MALTDSSRIYSTRVRNVDEIMSYCKEYFERKEYSVTTERTLDGGFISLTKGGIFQSIAGMKTGLNITLSQMPGSITASMKIGLFGKQMIPAAIAMLVFWPILIPQIYGLVQQNKLDQEAYGVIEAAIRMQEDTEMKKYATNAPEHAMFCVACGAAIPADADFCVSCGKRVKEETVCSGCGAELAANAVFCHKCGVRVKHTD